MHLCRPERFFSYRRATHRGEPDYGRHVNAIALAIKSCAARLRPLRLDSRPLAATFPPGRGDLRTRARPQGVDGVGCGRRAVRARGVCCRPRVLWPPLCASRSPAAPRRQPADFRRAARGATVAFELIDGPPPGQFRKLCRTSTRRRSAPDRGDVARKPGGLSRARLSRRPVARGTTTVAWVWDVYDADEHRALAHHRRRGGQGPAPQRLGRRRRRDAARIARTAWTSWRAS